jgi:hypothetical protein|tara:strand:- start:18075 stop:18281 length:207 start_codon:yes stop_codon:yes gene_type:complete
MGHKTYSRTSPKDGRRATLGTNGKYSRENNKGFMINQGIGNLEGTIVSILSNSGEERVINSSSTDYQL